jgi:hypothetical protein
MANTTVRSGWNTRGGTWREHLRLERDLADVNNEESAYWQNCAEAALLNLLAIIGEEDYTTWAEMVWPGETIDNHTYKAIYETARAAIEAAEKGGDVLGCTCKPDGDTCPACRAYLRTHYQEPAEDDHLEAAYELRYEGYDDSYPY